MCVCKGVCVCGGGGGGGCSPQSGNVEKRKKVPRKSARRSADWTVITDP